MLIPLSHIEPTLSAIERHGAIHELLRLLVNSGAVALSAESPIYKAFTLQEETRSACVGSGIAIPFIFSPLVTESLITFGYSREGVDFDPVDEVPVQIVLLAIFPSHEEKNAILKQIALDLNYLSLPGTREALNGCFSAAEMKRVLENSPNQ